MGQVSHWSFFIFWTLGSLLVTNGEVNLIGAKNAIKKNDDNTEETKTFVVQAGASPGKLAVLNDVPPAFSTVIFLDAAVGHDGKVGFWQFFSNSTGKICFCIYNKIKDEVGTVMVESAGRNCIDMSNEKTTGFTEVEIPAVQRLTVKPSSIVAVEYDMNNFPADKSVITVESNMRNRTYTGISQGAVMVQKDSDIRAGEYFTVEPYFVEVDGQMVQYKAFPSFKAIIVGITNVLDLRYGATSREGVAMIFMNNVWGTICDLWFHEKGWPYLFCAQKDFPDTEQIFYTTGIDQYEVPNNTEIHLMNPRCKFSQNVTMFSCATHPNATCNHTHDLFIRCKSKVELRKGSYPSEGVCYVYQSNYWGTVCDKRDLNLVQTDSNHWAHVCCRERGFTKAREAKKARDVIINENMSIAQMEDISLHSPLCTGAGNVTDIKNCVDGPLSLRCDHNDDIYVYCQ